MAVFLINPFLKRLVEIDGLIAVHGRAEAGCRLSAPERGSSFPPFPKIPNPKVQRGLEPFFLDRY